MPSARIEQGLFKVLLLAAMSVSFFIFHIWVRTVALTTGYRVGELRREIALQQSELVEAKIAQTRLMGPESLQRLVGNFAQEGLVFQPPKSSQLIYVKSRQ